MTDKQKADKLRDALNRVVVLRRLLFEAEADLRGAVNNAQQPEPQHELVGCLK